MIEFVDGYNEVDEMVCHIGDFLTGQQVTTDEIAYSNMLQIDVVLRLLLKKGIITKQEYNDELQEVRQEMAKKGKV